jgi:23S rRNA (cytidine1920-2'-O)/16S rRNA (cytidine1409-2'-O)-methyltransferase
MKVRLDNEIVKRSLLVTRSQAESYIKLGKVEVEGKIINKPGYFVKSDARIVINQKDKYVNRAALKLESIAKTLQIDFKNKVVLDVGSSTGGFTDFALQNRVKKVIAVDVGTNQMHPSLLNNPKIELHEKTDIRYFKTEQKIDLVLIDVSFISLRDILPSITKLLSPNSKIVAMLKPQFEAGENAKHKGVIKNDAMRRRILNDFESWVKDLFVINNKADSQISGAKGNLERFYLLTKH